MAADSWLSSLPDDFYTHVAQSLSLHGMAAAELLGHPAAGPLGPVQRLAGLTLAEVQRLNRISSQQELLDALRTTPLELYHLLLLGRLTLGTSLARPVLAYVQRHMHIEAAQLTELVAYCTEVSGAWLGLMEEHVPAPAGSVSSLGLHRLRIEEAFAAFLAQQPAAAPVVASLRLTEPQLHMLRLAVLLVHSLPGTTTHAFVRAVAELPALQPAQLEPLMEQLGRSQAQEPLSLTMPELVQLYQAMQVCGMVFVSDVMSRIGLEDAFPTLPDTEKAATEPTSISQRQAVGEMVSGFTHWVQHTFPDSAEIQQARTQVLQLADALG